jgi:hypothetical protein
MLFRPRHNKLLLEHVDATEQRIASLVEQQRQLHEALVQQQIQHKQEIEVVRDTFSSQIAQLCEVVDRQRSEHKSWAAHINDSQQHLEQLRDVLTTTLTHQEKQTQHRLHEFESCLTELHQAVEHMTHLLTTQTERQADALREQRKEMESLLAEHSHDVGNVLQGVNQDEAADLAVVNQRVEQIEVQLQQLTARGVQTKKAPAQRTASHPAQKAARQRK